jgi:hypothetical protein
MEWFDLVAEQSPVFYVHHHLIKSSLSVVSWAGFIRLGDSLLLVCSHAGLSMEVPDIMRMPACNSFVPAADAKKADGASDDTRRMPNPPLLTGKLAFCH